MDAIDKDILKGLRSLSESAFPKHCSVCGRQFESVADFVRETGQVSGSRGLKEGWDDDDSTIVELFRNCPCGSTLMDFFGDRRDTSEAGLKRRESFGQIMTKLVSRGIPEDTARSELLKVLKGQNSPVLEKMGFKIKRK
jgi:hypothetical protein